MQKRRFSLVRIIYGNVKNYRLITWLNGCFVCFNKDNGTLFKENFKKAKIDLNEFLVQCRTNGLFNLSDIKTALLEENGKISFLPYSDRRPANPSDFNIKPKEDSIVSNLILDGKVMEENLKELQLDKLWLNETLQKQGITKIDNIFLATYTVDGNLSVYLTNNVKE